jgi:parallel beta-helix repeat protein
LIDSNNNHVFNNELSEIAATGIMVWYYSNNNTISDNIVETNQVGSYGIFLSESSYNKLYNNEISSKNASFPGHNDSVIFKTGFYAIFLQYSNQNEIIGNEISLYQNALALINSNKNVISKNNLTSCWYAGLVLANSNLNLIKNNNFINDSFITMDEIIELFGDIWEKLPTLMKILIKTRLKSQLHEATFSGSYLNKWRGNYWDSWPGVIPKPIKGTIGKNGRIPWRNFDLFPKIKPIVIEKQSYSEKDCQSLVRSNEIEDRLLETLLKDSETNNEETYNLPAFGINLLDYIDENDTTSYNMNDWLEDWQEITIDL